MRAAAGYESSSASWDGVGARRSSWHSSTFSTRTQKNSCSCLTLIVACIIYWQAREMSAALRLGDPEADGVDISMLKHISPIEWSNSTSSIAAPIRRRRPLGSSPRAGGALSGFYTDMVPTLLEERPARNVLIAVQRS